MKIETQEQFSQHFSEWYVANPTDKILLLTNKKGLDLILKWFGIELEETRSVVTDKSNNLFDTGILVYNIAIPSFPPIYVGLLEVDSKKSKASFFMFADINKSIISIKK